MLKTAIVTLYLNESNRIPEQPGATRSEDRSSNVWNDDSDFKLNERQYIQAEQWLNIQLLF